MSLVLAENEEDIKARNKELIDDSFVTMQFTSGFQEKDIVFGGDKKLAKIMDEIQELFPLNKGITVQSEYPIGLIGDGIEAVSKVARSIRTQGEK